LETERRWRRDRVGVGPTLGLLDLFLADRHALGMAVGCGCSTIFACGSRGSRPGGQTAWYIACHQKT
jgi:hypothetical protein